MAEEGHWLLGGMSGRLYAGNTASLHRYLIEHHPDLPVYWVIDRDSPGVEKARQVGPVLYREDLGTYVYGLLARVHVISHGLADVPTCGSRLSNSVFKVRLGHGLTALKRTKGSLLRGVEAKNREFDLVPVSSAFEAAHKMEWGLDPGTIVVTGLPRLDDLLKKARLRQELGEGEADAPSRIVYVPTWRDWLPRQGSRFRRTRFYEKVLGFLRHPDLEPCLARHNSVLEVHLHVILQQHARALAAAASGLPHVKISVPGADLQDALARSNLLITDYSSVAWDFLYLDRPVLFYQFDREEFEQHRGAYMDLGDLFGPVAREPVEAASLTCRFLETGFDAAGYGMQMARWKEKAFQYHDERNCERVVAAILARLPA
jgi:CDP-glycerol glycerophosphotransferase (TagB/SpsB family)